MRFVMLGAGAVGGVLGGLLFEAGHDVVLVARGAHLAALQRDGLTLERPAGRVVLPIAAASKTDIAPQDVVVLAVKSQDTAEALRELPPGTTIVCAQNGVQNEKLAIQHGPTLGALVWMYALHLEPGVVALYGSGTAGVLDLGVWPGSAPVPRAQEIAEAFVSAGFESTMQGDIRAWKFTKLLCNLPGVLALTDRVAAEDDQRALLAEGCACLDAAGVDYHPVEHLLERCAHVLPARIDGRERPGGSLWQSKQRAAGSELQWLSGYIVKLGQTCGVPTPLNGELLSLGSE